MHVRRSVVCLAILFGFPAFPATVPQDVPATDPGAALAAMERPRISGEIDAPEVLTVGQAEVRPAAGARVFLLSASGRTCGVLIDGSATVTYRVRDGFSIPLARRNAGRASGITLRDAPDAVTLSGSLRGAAIWGWNLDVATGSLRPAAAASLPAWLEELLEDKLETNPGRDMLLSAWNGEAGFRWALFHTGGDDLMLDVDPRPAIRLESLHRVRRLPRNSGPFGGSWTAEELVSQPIDRTWWQPGTIDFASVDTDIQVRNPSGDHVSVRTRSRLQSFRDGLRALSLSLQSATLRSTGERRAFTLTGLTVDGAPAPYVQHRDSLIVLLPRALQKNESTVLETIAEGEILERPEGDSYWRLGDESWYPRPFVGGIERAAFRISVETSAPLVPFAPGQVLERGTAAQARKVVTRLNGPMDGVHVIAGKYATFTEEGDGSRIHVSTYATARKDDAVRVARIAQGVQGCLTEWLGVPYPFQDLQLLEITDWGWGQAPPGFIFVTQEAFLTRARAAALDELSTFIAGQVSRGINERVAHEVAHAWFPHVAKVDRSEETWLSESLADYVSAVCLSQLDARGGKARFSRQVGEWKYMAGQLSADASIFLASHLGGRQVDWQDRQSLLYARGPLVLHAIRHELGRIGGNQQEGDRLFFAWLRSYIRNFTFKTGETRHLMGILNQITKKDWQPWFERYVYGAEAAPLD